jgi:hypothetical protein
MFQRLSNGARYVQSKLSGDVSKNLLLTTLLPITLVLFFGTLCFSARSFPGGYDWRIHTISKLASADTNPDSYRVAALGVTLAVFLVLPFAGYVSEYLRQTDPRVAWLAGVAFATGFALTIVAMGAEVIQANIPNKIHNIMGHSAGASFLIGMICCSVCAIKARFQMHPERRLSAALTCYWTSLTVLPLGAAIFIGAVILAGKHGGQAWAEAFRQSFRHSVVWRLAFWEWVGVIGAFTFIIGTILLVPVQRRGRESELARRQREPIRSPLSSADPI